MGPGMLNKPQCSGQSRAMNCLAFKDTKAVPLYSILAADSKQQQAGSQVAWVLDSGSRIAQHDLGSLLLKSEKFRAARLGVRLPSSGETGEYRLGVRLPSSGETGEGSRAPKASFPGRFCHPPLPRARVCAKCGGCSSRTGPRVAGASGGWGGSLAPRPTPAASAADQSRGARLLLSTPKPGSKGEAGGPRWAPSLPPRAPLVGGGSGEGARGREGPRGAGVAARGRSGRGGRRQPGNGGAGTGGGGAETPASSFRSSPSSSRESAALARGCGMGT
ncbi:translation initiation factor IF-2-like [Panthera uncia]|uniref:translation initiation factor IF-2-like n=1 Tax=Panthera uncia TaxID=29064 RepID=UPI0020FFC3E8|nr:translation initiation factor IF-2-like [Panthera uncia]